MAIAVATATARSRAAPAAPTAPTTEEWLRCAHTRCCGRTGSYSELPPGRCCISHPSAPSASLSYALLTAVQGRSSPFPCPLPVSQSPGNAQEAGDPFPASLSPPCTPKVQLLAAPALVPLGMSNSTTSFNTDLYKDFDPDNSL